MAWGARREKGSCRYLCNYHYLVSDQTIKIAPLSEDKRTRISRVSQTLCNRLSRLWHKNGFLFPKTPSSGPIATSASPTTRLTISPQVSSLSSLLCPWVQASLLPHHERSSSTSWTTRLRRAAFKKTVVRRSRERGIKRWFYPKSESISPNKD